MTWVKKKSEIGFKLHRQCSHSPSRKSLLCLLKDCDIRNKEIERSFLTLDTKCDIYFKCKKNINRDKFLLFFASSFNEILAMYYVS